MTKEIFDIQDIKDLPETVASEIRTLRVQPDTFKLLQLFEIKNPLSIDEILVGLFRKYGLSKTRVWVGSTIYNISKKGLVKNIEKGIYKRIKP